MNELLDCAHAPKSSRFRDARFDRFLDALKAIQDFTFEQTLPNVEKQLRIILNGSLALFASCLIVLVHLMFVESALQFTEA